MTVVSHVTATDLLEAATRFDQRGKERDAITCRDMAHKLHLYGSFKSLKQSDYARKLVDWSKPQQMTTPPQATADLANTEGIKRIAQLFATARSKGLKKARIDVVVADDDGVVPLTMKPAKVGGMNPEGTIYVTCTATETYLGKVMPDGQFQKSRSCEQEELDALIAFAKDPEGVARASGRITSNCCFCRKKLTTPESVAVGYGPSCAENFGLEWGSRKVEVVRDLRQ